VITQLPWPDEMRGSEDCAENNAKTTDNNVCNTQERVLASHYRARGDEHLFGSAIEGHIELYYTRKISKLWM
jgi:hypothetical protein